MKSAGSQATPGAQRLTGSPSDLDFEGSSETAGVETVAAQTRGPLSLARDFRYLMQNIRTALPLMASDQFVLLAAVLVAAQGLQMFGVSQRISISTISLCVGCGLFIAFIVGELYPGVGLPPVMEVRQCSISISVVFVVFLLATQLYGGPREMTVVLVVMWIICLTFIPVCRAITRRFFCRFRWWMQPVLIFGYSYERWKLVRALETRPYLGLSPIGMLDDSDVADEAKYFGPSARAQKISQQRGVYRAIVAMPKRPEPGVRQIVQSTFDWFPHLLVLPNQNGMPFLWIKGWDMAGHAGFQSRNRLLLPMPRLAKRVMDLTVVFAAGVLLAPLFLLIAVAIKCGSPGSVFYCQERVGRGGRCFRAWKFRTMVIDADEVLTNYLKCHPELCDEWKKGHKLKNDPRIIRWVGRWLRKSSLDELPQLWNVLMGEMSLVGPRPLPQYHLDQFDEEFRRYRQKITPGITGMWQVASRRDPAPERFVRWDSYYIRNWSIWLDLRIIFMTIKVVISGDGAC